MVRLTIANMLYRILHRAFATILECALHTLPGSTIVRGTCERCNSTELLVLPVELPDPLCYDWLITVTPPTTGGLKEM